MDMFIFINEMLSRKRYKEHEVRQYIRSDETILKCEHIWIWIDLQQWMLTQNENPLQNLSNATNQIELHN